MKQDTVYLTSMFPDYEPPEELLSALSQAAIVAADIDPASRRVHVAVHSEQYIPRRLLEQAEREIGQLYGLSHMEVTATHPASELTKLEPEELRDLFVTRNSMTRGSLAGATWEWEGTNLTVKLRANGKKELEKLIPEVQNQLRERFAAPVTIRIEAGQTLEGQALFDAMESMRTKLMDSIPAIPAKPEEKKPDPQSDTFYGKPFRGIPVPMSELNLDMGAVIVEGRVFNVEHKELKKRNAWVIGFDMTDNTNSIHINRFLEAGEAKPILENVQVGSVLKVQERLELNRYDNEMVLKPYAMMPGSMPKRKDTAEGMKRV